MRRQWPGHRAVLLGGGLRNLRCTARATGCGLQLLRRPRRLRAPRGSQGPVPDRTPDRWAEVGLQPPLAVPLPGEGMGIGERALREEGGLFKLETYRMRN